MRILSGDHRDSAVSAAVSIGILQSLDQEEGVVNSEELQVALDELLIEVEETEREGENRGKTWAFKNKESEKAFRTGLKRNVVVVYRATPRVKHMFAAAIRMSGSPCGVTGESLNDARALSEGTVGFAMGEDGCSAAKDHADIILLDDNFLSVVSAIRWGRNIMDNIRKFIQF